MTRYKELLVSSSDNTRHCTSTETSLDATVGLSCGVSVVDNERELELVIEVTRLVVGIEVLVVGVVGLA